MEYRPSIKYVRIPYILIYKYNIKNIDYYTKENYL